MRLKITFVSSIMFLLYSQPEAAPKPQTPRPASAPTKSFAAPPIKPDIAASKSKLDTDRVHDLYQEGDFEQAIRLITASMENGLGRNHADSVFAYKHLGVMYAANADTRERGKYFMMQLLLIEPSARIMDMYASDMIYMIFRNIQEEMDLAEKKYNRAQGHVEGNRAAEPLARPVPASPTPDQSRPARSRDAEDKKSYAWLGWTGAIVIVVGAGVTAYMLANTGETQIETQQVE